MPRTPRLVLTDVVHHVVARGVNRCEIFANGFEKAKYLKRFGQVAEEEKVLIHGYCLLRNHVHWLLTPATPDGLARLFNRVHTWWALWFNRKHHRTGHLFQSRYYSSPLGESHYWTALRYVELNPKRAGLSQRLDDWDYSSARSHLSGMPDPLLSLAPMRGRRSFSAAQWRDFLEETDQTTPAQLRLAQAASRPCGNPSWLTGLEQKYHRKLAWSPAGRPKQTRRATYAA
mgnify:FL=1